MKNRIKEYRHGLTFHGITWFLSGNIMEKIAWASAIILVVGFAMYMINGYVMRYLQFEVRTEIRYEENSTITLPTIVFCLSSTITSSGHCYKNNTFCNVTMKVTLKFNKIVFGENKGRAYFSSINDARYIGKNCYVVNENGTIALSGASSLVALYFEASSSDTFLAGYLDVFFLSLDEYHRRIEKILLIEEYSAPRLAPGKYILHISQTKLQRLLYPYSTNCTTKNPPNNKLSKSYSRKSCQMTCLLDQLISTCGDIPY